MIFSDYLESMNNIWDYNEYVSLCNSKHTLAMQGNDYYSYVGNVVGIMFMSGIDCYHKAYNIFLEGVVPNAKVQSVETMVPIKTKCGSCGGGKNR